MSEIAYSPIPPPVILWFKVYAGFMSFLYALCAVLAVVIMIFTPDMETMEAFIVGGILLAISGPLLVAYLLAIFIRPARWVWILDIVLIGIGLTSCLTIPACIPLLIYWLKPETKAYFGRT